MRHREPRLWISALGASLDDGSTGETRHEEDLPLCCRSGAEIGEAFQCAVCGAIWQLPMSVEPEFDAFTYRFPDENWGVA